MISNLQIYNIEVNKNQIPGSEDTVVQQPDQLSLPKLSDIKQDESQGLVSDIQKAIKNNESEGHARFNCVLQRTTFEFEQSEKLSKIRAIRGLTPNKDFKIQLSDSLKALLVSKTSYDCRFKAMDSAILQVDSADYKYIRVRNSDIFEGSSPQFRKIYMVNTVESGTSLIIFLPHKQAQ